MNEEDLRALLSEMRDDPLPPNSVVRIRARIAARTQPRTWPKWSLAISSFGMACLAVFLILFWPFTPAHPPELPAVAFRPNIPLGKSSQRQEMVLERHRPAHRPVYHRSTAKRKSQDSGLVIRVETPDPNVVILLIGE